MKKELFRFSLSLSLAMVLIPVAIINSQTLSPEKINSVREKEAENIRLTMKIEENQREINELLVQYIGVKKVDKKRSSIYSLFSHKKKPIPQKITEPIPLSRDTVLVALKKVDSIAPVAPVIEKREGFFKRLFNKIFKRKKMKHFNNNF